MDSFEIGDFIRLKDVSIYEINRVKGSEVNVFEIRNINAQFVEIGSCNTPIPIDEILPIEINGKDDFHIYYVNTLSCTPYIDPSYPAILRTQNKSYYFEDLKNHTYDGSSYQKLVIENGCRYVHEIQHYLHDKFKGDRLEIYTY